MEILIGCDPEVFVRKDGEFKSAHGLIKGNKRRPFEVEKGAVQVDGMALEFNISPAKSCDEFILNIETVFDQLKKMVPDYEIVTVPVADFDPEYMKTQPREALELGCDPDYNAWTGNPNPRPEGDRPMRTASGHIHIGWTQGMKKKDVFDDACAVGKQMDIFLGLPSVLFDTDNRRREMYGAAGAIRAKPYGCEYRTLSNAWLKSRELMEFVYNNAIIGMDRLIKGERLFEDAWVEKDVRNAINKSDKIHAKALMNYFGVQGI